MIYAFDHTHKAGDVCSVGTCADARRAPVLAGSEVIRDIPMRIVREATNEEYETQPTPEGFITPPLDYGCLHTYEVAVEPCKCQQRPCVCLYRMFGA